MQDQRHVDGGTDGLHDVLVDVRLLGVHAVSGAHADGERGAAGALDELLGLDRVGVGGLALDLDVVLLAANLAERSLDRHAMQAPASATDLVRAMLSSKDSWGAGRS